LHPTKKDVDGQASSLELPSQEVKAQKAGLADAYANAHGLITYLSRPLHEISDVQNVLLPDLAFPKTLQPHLPVTITKQHEKKT
jgi:hypothetical protein